MTWDNIKIGFLKLWAENKEFRKLVIGVITWPIFTGYWAAMLVMWYPGEEGWKVVLVSIAAGFVSAILLLFLFEIGAGIRYLIQKLNDIGQHEKDRVFSALGGQVSEDENREFKEIVEKIIKSQNATSGTPTGTKASVDQKALEVLEALRKSRLAQKQKAYTTATVTDPYPDRPTKKNPLF